MSTGHTCGDLRPLGHILLAVRQLGQELCRLHGGVRVPQDSVKVCIRRYSNAVLEYGKGSDEAKKFEREIGQLSSELKSNQQRLKDASTGAEALGDAMEVAASMRLLMGSASPKVPATPAAISAHYTARGPMRPKNLSGKSDSCPPS